MGNCAAVDWASQKHDALVADEAGAIGRARGSRGATAAGDLGAAGALPGGQPPRTDLACGRIGGGPVAL
jgi:hypothetical protein